MADTDPDLEPLQGGSRSLYVQKGGYNRIISYESW